MRKKKTLKEITGETLTGADAVLAADGRCVPNTYPHRWEWKGDATDGGSDRTLGVYVCGNCKATKIERRWWRPDENKVLVRSAVVEYRRPW